MLTHARTYSSIWRDEGGEDNNTSVRKQLPHFTDPPNILLPVLRTETKVLVQAWGEVIGEGRGHRRGEGSQEGGGVRLARADGRPAMSFSLVSTPPLDVSQRLNPTHCQLWRLGSDGVMVAIIACQTQATADQHRVCLFTR